MDLWCIFVFVPDGDMTMNFRTSSIAGPPPGVYDLPGQSVHHLDIQEATLVIVSDKQIGGIASSSQRGGGGGIRQQHIGVPRKNAMRL